VTINGAQFGSRTPAKLASQTGEYSVSMTRDGYLPWQKTIPIHTSSISWVTYPRLIPEERKPESVASYPATVASALPSGSSRYYAVLESESNPVVSIARLDSDTVQTEEVALPRTLYTDPTPERPLSHFSIERWAGNDKRLLLSHTYGEGAKEWILLDLDQPEDSVNITSHLGISGAMSEPVFSVNDGSELYALIDGDVRIIDLDRQTLSRPLVQDVVVFSLYGNGFILFTQQDESGVQSVGYVKEDYREPRIIDTIENSSTEPSQLSIGKYFDKYYFLITNGPEAKLSSSRNLPDNSTAELERTHQKTLQLENAIIHSNITDNGQLAMVQDGTSFSTYNLELDRLSSAQVVNEGSPSTQILKHLDRYLLWGVNEGALRTYEFDGENQYDVMPVKHRFGATLSPNGKYLYALADSAEDGEGIALTRLQLLP